MLWKKTCRHFEIWGLGNFGIEIANFLRLTVFDAAA